MRRRDFLAAGATAAMALGGRPAFAASGAAAAVEAARRQGGGELTMLCEAGPQAEEIRRFGAPRWQEATGIRVNAVEAPVEELFTRIEGEQAAGRSGFDALSLVPSWLPDLARAGALDPLDAYVDRYGYREELLETLGVYRDRAAKVEDRLYGLPDDGDVLVLLYRTDVLADPKLRQGFKEQHGRELPAPPQTWQEFSEIAAFITATTDGRPYGAGCCREPALAQLMFQERFRTEGGRFFDADSMQATVNSVAGIKVLTDWLAESKAMPPDSARWSRAECLAAFLDGKTAMTIARPSAVRAAAGYGGGPASQVAGRVGCALPPGGHPELAGGTALGVSSGSTRKEAAYLFIQWLNSKEISAERVQLPYGACDPFRESHLADTGLGRRWPGAGAYLKTLREGAASGLVDLSILASDSYDEALRRATARIWAGEEPKAILDRVAAEWDAITQRVGVERQKAAYALWASALNAYPKVQ